MIQTWNMEVATNTGIHTVREFQEDLDRDRKTPDFVERILSYADLCAEYHHEYTEVLSTHYILHEMSPRDYNILRKDDRTVVARVSLEQ